MAENEYSPNIIPNYETDWDGIDPSNGLEWSGESVQKFVKTELKKKTEAQYFDPVTNNLYAFASEADKKAWEAGGGDAYVLSVTPFNFSGTQDRIVILPDSDINLTFTTAQDTAVLSMGFRSETKGITDTAWTEVFEDFLVSVYVDRGATGSYTTIVTDVQVMNGKKYAIDVKKYLAAGSNRVRILAKGAISGKSANLIYNINVTTMYLRPSNFNWHLPYVEGDTYPLGGFNIGGNIPKLLNINVSNEELGYNNTFSVDLGTATYVTTAFHWKGWTFPEAGTGVYRVEAWLDASGLESDHLVYNIMCVAAADVATAELGCINNVSSGVKNGMDAQLFQYAIYNKGAATGDVVIELELPDDGVFYEDVLRGVSTASVISYSAALELEREEAKFDIVAVLATGESLTSTSATIPVDNSLSFPATTGATFYLNPATRNNNQENRTKIINEATKAEIDTSWIGMGWTEGVDGWTTDSDGRKCLLIPAGSKADVALQPLATVGNGKTIELCYKIATVSDYDENIITMASNPTAANFQGIQIKPKRVSVHSRDLKDTLSQSYPTKDEELVHVVITIVKNYRTNYGNLCRIFVNGGTRCSFEFTATDSFAVAQNLILGSETADMYLYKARIYDNGFGWEDAAKNYVNCLPDATTKEAAWNEINQAMNDSYEVDFDKVNGVYNTMVIEMRDGGTIPNLLNPDSGQCNLWINILDPLSGELDSDFSYLFGNNLISDVTIEGQGTTSSTYFRWNFRWKLPSLYNKRRITAKKNVASSMHSHKMGATRMYNDLHDACVGANELGARTAVFQYPVYGFEKRLVEGTTDQYVYIFIGLYTIGPDKGDPIYFGFKDDSVSASIMHLEGTDHTPTGVGMEYPWDAMRYDAARECIGGILSSTDIEGAWEVGAAGELSPDEAEDQDAVQAMLDSEFQPAYEVAYRNSPYIQGITDTLDTINTSPSSYRTLYSGMEIWTDGVYDVYYYNIETKTYQPTGNNLLTQFGLNAADLPSTIEEKNELFKNLRIADFKANMGNYWHQADAIFHYTFCLMIGATDNFKKNTYPYKYYLLADGGLWRWRQDDLDSILDINNQGFSAKSFSTLVGDLTSTGSGSVFRGDNSVFWTLIRLAFVDEIRAMAQSILTKMAERSPYGGNTLDRCVGYFKAHFWDMAQDYFGEGSYNADNAWTYDEAWYLRNQGQYNNDVHPLGQALGSHYEAERDWVVLRIVFLASYFGFGPFAADNGSDTSTGQISFRAAGGKTYRITPALDINPTILIGQSATVSAGGRIYAGNPADVVVPDMGNNDTHIYIQGTDYYSSIGDLCDIQVSADNPVLTVASKRMRELKVGDETAANVTSNVGSMSVGACPALETIDARNLASLTGTVDLSQCPRIDSALFAGTSLANVVVPAGSKINTLSLPDSLTTLSLLNLPNLTFDNLDEGSLENISYLRVEGNAHLDGMSVLRAAMAGGNLTAVRILGISGEGTSEDINLLAALADSGAKGITPTGEIDESSGPIVEGELTIMSGISASALEKVQAAFPNLNVIAMGSMYVEFVDEEAGRVFAEKYGDGTGITYEQMAAITSINSLFQNNSVVQYVPELELCVNITSNTNWAFSETSALVSVALPPNITTLGTEMFAYSKFKFLIVPASVTTLNSWSFRIAGTSDTILIFESVVPPTANGGAFDYYQGSMIYVPDESVEAYKTATNWTSFASRILPLSEYTE